jgi:hypothetical protein
MESKPQNCGSRDHCKFRRIHYELAKNACFQCSKSRTDTHKVKCRLLFQLATRACCQSHPVKMFINATMPRNMGNQNSELFLRHEVSGCLQLWVLNPKLGLSAAVKCDPVFRMCNNDPSSIHIPDN